MWIERVEFIGFGNLTGQRIQFGRNKLSVVVQPNEYGKSTIAESIWATLFDYPEWDPALASSKPGIERQPLSGAAFKTVLDLNNDDRRMRLIRNFSERSVKVLDLSKDLGKANADITSEFAQAIANDLFGKQLTGLTRELFRSCCVVGQRDLSQLPFAGNRGLSSLLLSIADTGGKSFNVFDAIAKLEERLVQFPYKGREFNCDELLDGLRARRESLIATMSRLENDRRSCDEYIEQIARIEDRLRLRARDLTADEYFQLCLEAADLDSRLGRAQDKLARLRDIEAAIETYLQFESVPIEKQRDVEELWISRQSRLSDLRRYESEVKERAVETQIRDLEQRERAEGLESFTLEDAQVLMTLARTLKEVTNELQQMRERRDSEFSRVQALGLNLSQLADTRAALLSLEPKELEDAHQYHSMLVAAKERAAECMHCVERAGAILGDINRQRDAFVKTAQRFFWPSLTMSCVLLAGYAFMAMMKRVTLSDARVSLVLAFYAIFLVIAAASFFGARKLRYEFRVNEEILARTEEQKQSITANELHGKIALLEARLEELARKAKLGNGPRLIHEIQEYAKSAAQLKELDLLDHMILTKEVHVTNLKQQMSDFFRKANRSVDDISAKEGLRLAEAVTRFLDDRRRFDTTTMMLDHRESEIRFLRDEVKHSEALLSDLFQRAGLTFKDVDEGYYQWSEAVVGYRRLETNRNDLNRLLTDTTTDLNASELPALIDSLELRKAELWSRIQELLVANPEISGLTPPVVDPNGGYAREIAELRAELDELKRERDCLTFEARAAMSNYQDNYLRTLEDLEAVERDFNHVSHHRTALLFARDALLRQADENHAVWADRLSDISRDMLRHLGTEYDSIEFDAELNINVRRKGQRDPLNEWQLQEQLSTGTREQLHWLARMAVVRLLSNHKPLPIILDEPFSEFDDERFLKIMRFLINDICAHNQVIILSCHQQRHEWLMDQLDPRERDSVETCRLVSLKAASVR